MDSLKENKLKILVKKEAAIWEHQLAQDICNIQQLPPRTPTPDPITFEAFVNNVWFPEYMNTGKRRAATVAFHNYILRIILPYLGNKKLSDIKSKRIEEYLDYLKNTYKTRKFFVVIIIDFATTVLYN